MKRTAISLAILVAIASCNNTKKVTNASPASTTAAATATGTADGLSFDHAIVINEKSETAGVHAEYAWLKQNYPGYKVKSQALAYNTVNLLMCSALQLQKERI